MDYRLENNQIYSEKGKLVATLDRDGSVVMEPGMAGPHKRGVEEFLEVLGNNEPALRTESESPEPEVSEESESGLRMTAETASELEKASEPEARRINYAEWSMQTIPAEDLPPFTKALGVNTPGFTEYVLTHKLTIAQVEALVERLNKQ